MNPWGQLFCLLTRPWFAIKTLWRLPNYLHPQKKSSSKLARWQAQVWNGKVWGLFQPGCFASLECRVPGSPPSLNLRHLSVMPLPPRTEAEQQGLSRPTYDELAGLRSSAREMADHQIGLLDRQLAAAGLRLKSAQIQGVRLRTAGGSGEETVEMIIVNRWDLLDERAEAFASGRQSPRAKQTKELHGKVSNRPHEEKETHPTCA